MSKAEHFTMHLATSLYLKLLLGQVCIMNHAFSFKCLSSNISNLALSGISGRLMSFTLLVSRASNSPLSGGMFLLGSKCCESSICRIRLHETLDDGDQVGKIEVDELFRHILSHDDTKDFDIVGIRRESIIRADPAFCS
jgi:hypothetical protein